MGGKKSDRELRKACLAAFVDAMGAGVSIARNDTWGRHTSRGILHAADDFVGAARFLAEQLRRAAAEPSAPTNPAVVDEFLLCLHQLGVHLELTLAPGAHFGRFTHARNVQ